MLVRPNVQCRVFVNVELEEKAYTRKGRQMCINDGCARRACKPPAASVRATHAPRCAFRCRFVCFRNSELLSGRLGKVTLGSGNKAGLFYALSSDYAPAVAANAMNRLAKLSARWLGTRGFSIGIADVTPDVRLIREKERQVNEGYAECERLIAQYKEGALQLLPGCTAEQTLESSILGVLSRVREVAGNVCLEQLPRHNSPLIMARCGSKGSTINICQMVACVGQQAVSGSRIQDGACGRGAAARRAARLTRTLRVRRLQASWTARCRTSGAASARRTPRASSATRFTRGCRPPSFSSTPWAGARGWWTRR